MKASPSTEESFLRTILPQLCLLSIIILLSNSCFAMLGQAARWAVIAVGIGLMGSCVALEMFFLKLASRRILLCSLVWLGVETFQYVRDQDVFALSLIFFRFSCFLCCSTGIIIGVYGLPRASDRPWAFVWLLAIVFASAAYLFSIYSTRNGSWAGRMVANEELNPVGIAYVYGGLACLSFVASKVWTGLFFKLAAYIGTALAIVACSSAGSRGGLIAAALTILAVFFLSFTKLSSITLRIFFAILSFSVLLAVAFAAQYFFPEQLEFLTYRFNYIGFGDASSEERFVIWRYYYDAVWDWVFFGLGGYNGDYPHNVYFEVWLRFGLVGFICFFALTLKLLSAFSRSLVGSEKTRSCALVMGVFGLFNSQFNLGLDMNRLLFVGLGCAFSYPRFPIKLTSIR